MLLNFSYRLFFRLNPNLMRQRGIGYPPAPAPMDYQQKGWYPTDPNYQAQGPPQYYPPGPAQPQMIMQQYPPQTMGYQGYPGYPQGIQQPQAYQYPVYRPEPYYPPEAEPSMMVYRPPVAQPQVPIQPTRSFQAPAAQRNQQSHPVQPIIEPSPTHTEKNDIQLKGNGNIDFAAQTSFNNLKYPLPGCFSLTPRGTLPGLKIIDI